MKTKILSYFPFIILGFSVTLSAFLIVNTTFAQPAPEVLANIVYPVAELENCKDETACAAYCDKPANLEACVAYAKEHQLMPEEEIAQAEKFIAAGSEGPGGCTSKVTCESYCNDISNIDECVAYAEKNGIISPKELTEAKKVQAAMKQGLKPPGDCRSKAQCDEYCNKPDNIEACITFAEAAGLIPPDELEEARMVIKVIKEKGIKPPPCGGKDECDVYCSQDEHFEECITFAEAAGFIDRDKAEIVRLTKGRGPGNCKRDECEEFCKNPDNQAACTEFMTKLLDEHPDLDIKKFIPPEDLAQMQEGIIQIKKSMEQAPDEVKVCIDETFPGLTGKLASGSFSERDMMRIGPGMREPMERCFSQFMPKPEFPPEVKDCMIAAGVDPEFKEGPPSPDDEEAMRNCFMQFGGGGPPGEGGPGFGPPGEGGGPGGASPEMMGCFKNKGWDMQSGPPSQEIIQECAGEFGPPGGMLPPDAPRLFGPGEDHPEGPNGEFGPPGGIPEGMMPEGFEGEGMEGQFPGGPPTSEQMQRMQEEGFDQQFKGQYPQQYQQQYEQERQRIEEQMRGQYGAPPGYEGGPPPGYEGGFPGGDGQYGPPPGDYQQPPPDGGSGEPQSSRSFLRLLGNAILNLFGVRTR